jgi:hypothetical protein
MAENSKVTGQGLKCNYKIWHWQRLIWSDERSCRYPGDVLVRKSESEGLIIKDGNERQGGYL